MATSLSRIAATPPQSVVVTRPIAEGQSNSMSHLHSFGLASRRIAAITALLTATASADPEPTAEARAHFEAGNRALQARNWAEAHREFKTAYAITPRWTVLGNLGLAADRLERDGEAIEALENYLRRGGADVSKAEELEVLRDINRLRSRVATVTLEAPGSFSIVDTRLLEEGAVVNKYGPHQDRITLRVRAGRHEFDIKRERESSAATWAINLVPGDSAAHAFDLDRAPVEAPAMSKPENDNVPIISHTASYVLWGAGAAAGVAATVLFLKSNRIQTEADEDFARRCPDGASGLEGCENRTAGDAKAANWRTASLVTGMGALGAIVAGTVLYFIAEPRTVRSLEEESCVHPWLSPSGVGLTGIF